MCYSLCPFLSHSSFFLCSLRSSCHRRNEHQHSKHWLHLRSKHGMLQTFFFFGSPPKFVQFIPTLHYFNSTVIFAANEGLHPERVTCRRFTLISSSYAPPGKHPANQCINKYMIPHWLPTRKLGRLSSAAWLIKPDKGCRNRVCVVVVGKKFTQPPTNETLVFMLNIKND